MTSAPHEAIIRTFLDLPYPLLTQNNWGTGTREQNVRWHVNEETYINGVLLTIDLDYHMGYLIEVIDRSTSNVNFFAVVTFHGPRPDGTQEHDSMWYDQFCGTFGERTDAADYLVVSTWAVSRIFGMVDAREDRRRTSER